MRDVIRQVFDAEAPGGAADFFEIQPLYARNIGTCFSRLGGRSVGIVANRPRIMAGALDIDASDKAARFIRFCGAEIAAMGPDGAAGGHDGFSSPAWGYVDRIARQPYKA